jgi:hypothetical protein
MTLADTRPYNRSVHSVLRVATAAAAVALFAFPSARAAGAQTGQVDVGDAAILNVQMKSGSLIIKTWDRRTVAIETSGSATWQHFAPDQVRGRIPLQMLIPAQSMRTLSGQDATLPPEIFVLPQLSGQPHDGVVVTGDGDVTVTVPASTALIVARVDRGPVTLRGYHNGVFVLQVLTGSMHLRNVSGSGFAQLVRGGPMIIQGSDFTRIRARSAVSNIFIAGTHSTQIEVTSIFGSIVYDNGSFAPGLARFESQYGNVALGVAGSGAQVGAHSSTGRVFTSFSRPVNLTNRNGSTQATFNGGGPVVTATARNGSVLLYDGSLRQHPRLMLNLTPAMQRFRRPPPTPRRRP